MTDKNKPEVTVTVSKPVPLPQVVITLANPPLEWLRKYSSSKPLHRPPPRK